MQAANPESQRHVGPVGIVASTAALASVRSLVGDFAAESGASTEFVDDLTLAVDEVCANIVAHGYADPSYEEAAFTIELEGIPTGIEVVIRDRGSAFDVQNAATPEIADWIARGKKGGLGLKLIKMLVDDVRYRRIDGVNEVRLCKSLPGTIADSSGAWPVE